MLDLQTQLYILSATFGAVIFLLIILVLVLALSVARWVHIISANILIFRLIILPVNQTTIFGNSITTHSITFQTFRRLAIYFLILRTFTIHPVARFGIRFFLFLPGLKNSFMRDCAERTEVTVCTKKDQVPKVALNV